MRLMLKFLGLFFLWLPNPSTVDKNLISPCNCFSLQNLRCYTWMSLYITNLNYSSFIVNLKINDYYFSQCFLIF